MMVCLSATDTTNLIREHTCLLISLTRSNAHSASFTQRNPTVAHRSNAGRDQQQDLRVVHRLRTALHVPPAGCVDCSSFHPGSWQSRTSRCRRDRSSAARRCRQDPSTPNGLRPAGEGINGSVVSRPMLHFVESRLLPHGYFRPSVPCAAYCHSISVGSRFARPAGIRLRIRPVDIHHRMILHAPGGLPLDPVLEEVRRYPSACIPSRRESMILGVRDRIPVHEEGRQGHGVLPREPGYGMTSFGLRKLRVGDVGECSGRESSPSPRAALAGAVSFRPGDQPRSRKRDMYHALVEELRLSKSWTTNFSSCLPTAAAGREIVLARGKLAGRRLYEGVPRPDDDAVAARRHRSKESPDPDPR